MTDCILAAAGQMNEVELAFQLFDTFGGILPPTSDSYAAILKGCISCRVLESVPLVCPSTSLSAVVKFCMLPSLLSWEKVQGLAADNAKPWNAFTHDANLCFHASLSVECIKSMAKRHLLTRIKCILHAYNLSKFVLFICR